MKLYRIVSPRDQKCPYLGDRAEAHELSKQRKAVGQWDFAEDRIEYVEFDVDKEQILTLLDNMEPNDVTVLKTWALTDRGGLKEVKNGE